MKSGIESEIGMELSMYRTMKSKVLVELRVPKGQTFTAQVNGFIYTIDEEDQVEFERLVDTVFPMDTDTEKSKTFVTTIRNIKKIERIKG